MTTTTTQAAKLSIRITGRNLANLEHTMTNGYTPSLNPSKRGEKALGQYLESKGHRVFWTR